MDRPVVLPQERALDDVIVWERYMRVIRSHGDEPTRFELLELARRQARYETLVQRHEAEGARA